MRLIIVSAIALLTLGAAHGSSPRSRPMCAFNLPLSPPQCARLHAATQHPGHSWWSGGTNDTLVYASQPFEAAVDVWALGAKKFKAAGVLALPGGSVPLGLTVDSAQNLYVAISSFGSATPSVEVFARGSTTPDKVYTQGLSAPVDVAVDHHGTLYVANLANAEGGGCAQGSGPGGSVLEYAKGSLTPTRTIADFPGCPSAVAVDSHANLYLTYIYYPTSGFVESDVIKYAYKSTHGKPLHLQVPGGPDLGGIALTPAGDIVVENVQADATLNQILTYQHGATKPANTIQYPGVGWGTGFKFFALLGDRLFAPAYVVENFSDVVTTLAEFAYPSGRERFVQTPLGTSEPFAYGIAVSPGGPR